MLLQQWWSLEQTERGISRAYRISEKPHRTSQGKTGIIPKDAQGHSQRTNAGAIELDRLLCRWRQMGF